MCLLEHTKLSFGDKGPGVLCYRPKAFSWLCRKGCHRHLSIYAVASGGESDGLVSDI